MLKTEATTKAVSAATKSCKTPASPRRELTPKEKAEMLYGSCQNNGPLMDSIKNALLEQYDDIIMKQGIMALDINGTIIGACFKSRMIVYTSDYPTLFYVEQTCSGKQSFC
ncbi:MAG: hypothetical protein VB071_02365 [Lawsonibacter sp.]|nr:hypothetical protein [Lawsonibacter sp.]